MAHNGTAQTPLGRFVEQKRLDLGLTKAEAARRANVSRGTWHEVESGGRMHLMPETMKLIEHALELDPGTLRRIERPLSEQELTAAAEGLLIAETKDVQRVLDNDVKMRRRVLFEAANMDHTQLLRLMAWFDSN